MVATITVRVYTGSGAGTESASVSGIDLINADNATNSSGNRTSNPVPVGSNSYDKHLRLKLDVAPATAITTVKFWLSGAAAQTNVAFRAKLAVGTGGATPGTGDATPATTTMTGDADAYSYTSGAKGTWDSASYSTINHVTKAALVQLQPNASATPGPWAGSTINYSYDET